MKKPGYCRDPFSTIICFTSSLYLLFRGTRNNQCCHLDGRRDVRVNTFMFLLKVIILFSLNYNIESTVTLIENSKKKRHSCMPAPSQEGNEEWVQETDLCFTTDQVWHEVTHLKTTPWAVHREGGAMPNRTHLSALSLPNHVIPSATCASILARNSIKNS